MNENTARSHGANHEIVGPRNAVRFDLAGAKKGQSHQSDDDHFIVHDA